MALIVYTSRPNALNSKIHEAIVKNKSIQTWDFDEQGRLIHVTSSGQWEKEATVTTTVLPNTGLLFAIQGPDNKILQKRAYAIYLGRLAEMLLAHFDKDFTVIQITALVEEYLGDEL